MTRTLIILSFLLTVFISYGQNQVWLIGTAHEKTNYINPDSLINAFNKIKPDLILVELEEQHFTSNYNFNFAEFPDILTTNENIASHRYQQLYGTPLRPFDINDRNKFYIEENYQERENQMFNEMLTLYKNNKLSENCKVDFEILLFTLNSYSQLTFSSMRELNSDVATKFFALKNKINFELMISIIKRTKELEKWVGFVELRKSFWDRRNKEMAENIIKYATVFEGRKIVVLVGYDHKYALIELLEDKGIKPKDYFEKEDKRDKTLSSEQNSTGANTVLPKAGLNGFD